MDSQFLLDYSHGREHRSLPQSGQGDFWVCSGQPANLLCKIGCSNRVIGTGKIRTLLKDASREIEILPTPFRPD